MKSICLFFQVHHPLKLKKYRFFNMGNDSFYLDEYLSSLSIVEAANSCYIPANNIILKKIKEYKGKFKVSFSISGTAIELFKTYVPEVLQSFKELAATGCVDFMVEPYAHSLASLVSKDEFIAQVKRHAQLIKDEFGITPTTFVNTELIYSSGIGEMVSEIGYNTVVTEGAKHILGWKSPDFVYADSNDPKIKLLLRNSSLCDDLRYRFGDKSWDQWPLTPSKYVEWINSSDGNVVNIFLDYEVFGCNNNLESGIFEFLENFPNEAIANDVGFEFTGTVVKDHQPVAALGISHPISWADEERDITSWFGNEIQREAIEQLYSIRDKVVYINDDEFNHVWDFMQSSNHFYYMSTKWFVAQCSANVNPYDSPYEAFMNYMNICSDFKRRVEIKYAELIATENKTVPENLAVILESADKTLVEAKANVSTKVKAPAKAEVAAKSKSPAKAKAPTKAPTKAKVAN